MKNQYLALPGPTPVCPEALQAMAEPMFNHRGPRFAELFQEVVENCRELFQTQEDLFILTASGTGAMEAAAANVLSRGDRVLSAVNGAFGQRFADIAAVLGADVEIFPGEWGKALDLDKLEKTLSQGTYQAITVVHCETSTAVLNQLQEIAKLRDRLQPQALLLVDAISSLGAATLPVDKWGLDVVVTGSQKVLAAPPGLAMVSFNQRAWQANEKSDLSRYYWDFTKYKTFMDKGETPYTPAISQFLALKAASARFVNEGLHNAVKRHQLMAAMTRSAVRALNLELLVADDDEAATTVTAIFPPSGMEAAQLRAHLRENQGLIVAGGQGKLATSIFRIGHLGIADAATVVSYIALLEKGLYELGHKGTPGAGVAAALSCQTG